jgi:hypothetical protein
VKLDHGVTPKIVNLAPDWQRLMLKDTLLFRWKIYDCFPSFIEKTNEHGTNRHDVGAVSNRTPLGIAERAVSNRTYALCHLYLSCLLDLRLMA